MLVYHCALLCVHCDHDLSGPFYWIQVEIFHFGHEMIIQRCNIFVCLCWIHIWLCNQVSCDVLYLISLYILSGDHGSSPGSPSHAEVTVTMWEWAGNETHAGHTYCCSGECRCHSFGRLVLELCLYTWSMVLPARTSDCFTAAIITASIRTTSCVQCCSPFGLKAWLDLYIQKKHWTHICPLIWLSPQLQTALHIMSEYSVEISSHTLYDSNNVNYIQ